ncbi:FliM/FliN family flagellar motor switch protein [Roseomonas marmotae]|uniref:Flagellar motor switch protein FliN n=1 Tax=Roseomonas marmotae TaxID=2768161 RepID=A0ABS3KGK2_9PROT|nr:FliM/FliN family flagellar motor switch protein [Roseomonas marmotae]MBO1076055.1 FliM/FliN family flagellar motor switch protein [Roseomonas marmotae]QTI81294.1 FliM/FliN family flagellar motor switch protein [Roseomonas marmotae]
MTSELPLDSDNPFLSERKPRIMDIPVNVQVVLGNKRLPMAALFNLSRGSVIEFDKKVGEPVDLLANERLIARGEIQITDDGRLSISITEIVSSAA